MSYGKYILSTGDSISDYELFFYGYFYKTKFAGKTPILDLGCGRCTFTKQNVNNIIAMDIEPSIVDYYSNQGLNIRLGNVYEIPFPDDYFEAVFNSWLLEHLEFPDKAMREIYRVLKPGGYSLTFVPSEKSLSKGFYDDFTHIRPFTKHSLLQLAKLSGFSKYSSSYLPWVKGIQYVFKYLDKRIASQYLTFSDCYLRKVNLINKYSLMIEGWK